MKKNIKKNIKNRKRKEGRRIEERSQVQRRDEARAEVHSTDLQLMANINTLARLTQQEGCKSGRGGETSRDCNWQGFLD